MARCLSNSLLRGNRVEQYHPPPEGMSAQQKQDGGNGDDGPGGEHGGRP
jgi:hypothetical protein